LATDADVATWNITGAGLSIDAFDNIAPTTGSASLEGFASYSANVTVFSGPDLEVFLTPSVSSPSVIQGDIVTFNYSVDNDSIFDAASSTTGIYLSDNSTISAADILVATDFVPSIFGGDSSSQSVSFSTSGLPLGTYFIGAIADYDDTIDEINEDNNASDGILFTITEPASQSIWTTQPENIELVASTYQFFTGGIPGEQGFEFLIDSPVNNGDLNDPFYDQFNLENAFINFANNLGSFGEGADEFALEFGNLTFAETIDIAFEEIIGSQAIINNGGNPQDSIDFFLGAFDFYADVAEERVVPDGVSFDQAVKVVAIGSILNEAFKADLGRYPDAVVEVTNDIAITGTTDLFGLDLFA